MGNLILIFLLVLTSIATAQKQPERQLPCNPPVLREIVSIDSLPVHHSFCLQLHKLDKYNRIVVSTTVCDTSNGNTYFLFDISQIGMKYDDYYDTTGRIIFELVSKNNKILECYNTIVYVHGSSIKIDYKEGYKLGEPIKISYEYDQYGNYAKKTVTTQNEITTITYTDRRDNLGNYIQETKITPRQKN